MIVCRNSSSSPKAIAPSLLHSMTCAAVRISCPGASPTGGLCRLHWGVTDPLLLVTVAVLAVFATIMLIRNPSAFWWPWPATRVHWVIWALLGVVWLLMMTLY